MLRTFNCGVGMVVVAGAAEAEAVTAALAAEGERPIRLGRIVERGAGAGVTTTGQLAP